MRVVSDYEHLHETEKVKAARIAYEAAEARAWDLSEELKEVCPGAYFDRHRAYDEAWEARAAGDSRREAVQRRVAREAEARLAEIQPELWASLSGAWTKRARLQKAFWKAQKEDEREMETRHAVYMISKFPNHFTPESTALLRNVSVEEVRRRLQAQQSTAADAES